MRKRSTLLLLLFLYSTISCSLPTNQSLGNDTHHIYIPNSVKHAIQQCAQEYPELTTLTDLSFFLDKTAHLVDQDTVKKTVQELIDLLNISELKHINPQDHTVALLEQYQDYLTSDSTVSWKISEPDQSKRSVKVIQAGNAQISLANEGFFTLAGGSNASTSAGGSTLTLDISSSPSFSGSMQVSGNITASGNIYATGSITGGSGLRASTGGLVVNGGGISATGPIILSSLSNGIMSTSATGLVSSTPTTNHAVQVGNTGGSLFSLPLGNNGQVLLGATNTNPSFAGLGATDASIRYISGIGTLSMLARPLFGNTLRVDSTYGNNATATRTNGIPYLTISAALTAALSGDTVLIFPGTYNESITIPTGVGIRGLNKNSVIISRVGVAVATTLVTMGISSMLANVTLKLTSASNVALTGISFPGTTTTTAMVDNVNLTITSTTGSANIYGVYSNGTGSPTVAVPNLHASSISVTSTGTQASRGLRLDTGANTFNVSDSTFIITSSGGGSGIGVETAFAGTVCNLDHNTISGTFADISQTLGTIKVAATKLVNADANGFEFTNTMSPNIYTWGFRTSAITRRSTVYLVPGGDQNAAAGDGTRANTEINAPQAMIIKTLNARTSTAVGSNTVYTLLVNGGVTSLTVTIASGGTSALSSNLSTRCNAGDLLALRQTSGNPGTGSTNVIVTAEFY